jgi:hypothetical protein
MDINRFSKLLVAGVRVLLLVLLGTAGTTSIIEAVVTSPEVRTDITEFIDVIIEDERLRRTSAEMKAAMKEQSSAGPPRTRCALWPAD